MRSLSPGHLAPADQAILRAVALSYRRAGRKALTEGVHFRIAEDMALAAAHAGFVQQRPEGAIMTKLQISGRVMPMIAAAINADTRWFWNGPDV